MNDLLVNIEVNMRSKTTSKMKKIVGICIVIAAVLISACSSSKPYYKTRKGKKKQKYYNEIQYGGKSASEMKKP